MRWHFPNHDVVLQTFIWPSDLVLMTVERSVSLTTGFLVSYIPSLPIDVFVVCSVIHARCSTQTWCHFPTIPLWKCSSIFVPHPIQYPRSFLPRSFLSLCNQEMHQDENTQSRETNTCERITKENWEEASVLFVQQLIRCIRKSNQRTPGMA